MSPTAEAIETTAPAEADWLRPAAANPAFDTHLPADGQPFSPQARRKATTKTCPRGLRGPRAKAQELGYAISSLVRKGCRWRSHSGT